MTINALHAAAIEAFRDRLASLGINVLEVLETARLGRGATAGAQSPPTVHEVLETAVAISGDTTLAIKIGNGLDLAKYGTYGFALMSSYDMRAALELFLRYGQTFLKSSSWHRSVSKDGIVLRLQQNAGTSYQKMLVTELAFSQIHLQSKLLVARPAEGVRVHFSYPKPAHFGAYEQNWPFPMEFEQENTQIFVPERWLRQRVRTGDPTTNVLFSQQCEELVGGMTEVDETAAIVRRLLIHSAGNFSSISEVAEKLHITERTLRRRLTAEGTDFRTIFDDIKNTLARNYLRKTSLSVVEIADLLNYSEATNFHRAFQRWNSITPADYRQQASFSKVADPI
jgi:AraC-like DNA-binding protein